MKVERLDHLVLTVRNLEDTIGFYIRVLGMELVEFGKGRKALRFGEQKINLHESGRELEPRAAAPVPGSADLCLVVAGTIGPVMAELDAHGVELELGPVKGTGALGPVLSVYIRDPDQNLVELSSYVVGGI